MMVTLDNALFWPVQSPQLRAPICPYTQQSCMMVMSLMVEQTEDTAAEDKASKGPFCLRERTFFKI